MTLIDYWKIATETCGTGRTILAVLLVLLFLFTAMTSLCIIAKVSLNRALKVAKGGKK